MAESIRDLLQPEILDASEGRAQLRFGIRPELTIPGGSVQGGIVAAMLDMAMAVAGDGGFSTASLQLQIFRPVREGPLAVKGEVVRRGRRVVFAQAEMHGSRGELLARGTQTAVPLTEPAV